MAGGEQREFVAAVGKAAQVEHGFRVGDHVSGESEPVEDARTEIAEFYKTARLRVLNRPATDVSSPPPWLGVPPDLEVYRARGHRRLDSKRFDASSCTTLSWPNASESRPHAASMTGDDRAREQETGTLRTAKPPSPPCTSACSLDRSAEWSRTGGRIASGRSRRPHGLV